MTFKEFINEKKLNIEDITYIYKKTHFTTLKLAKELAKSNKNYEVGDDNKSLYRMTTDEGGTVGDFALSIATQKDLDKISKDGVSLESLKGK